MGSNRVQPHIAAKAVTVAGIEFDNNFYDRDVDVLYLHVGEPASAVDFDGTAEGDVPPTGPTGASSGSRS